MSVQGIRSSTRTWFVRCDRNVPLPANPGLARMIRTLCNAPGGDNLRGGQLDPEPRLSSSAEDCLMSHEAEATPSRKKIAPYERSE